MRRLAAATGVVALLATAGYAAADVFDLVPGVLTRAPAASAPTATPTGTPVHLPTPVGATMPLPAAGLAAPEPGQARLTSVLAPLTRDPAFGSSVGVVVRDGLTGQTLFTREPDRPRLAASTQKLLAAAAIASTTDLSMTMATTVVQGSRPGEIVLVAGGDTMLARGGGNLVTTPGRAGIGDLASQVAGALRQARTTKVTLRLDLSYAAGPAYAPAWLQADVGAGAVQGVHMIGLADQRPRIGHPSPRDPAMSVAQTLLKDLAASGVKVTLAPRSTWSTRAAAGARVLGEVRSAPFGEVLTTALADSDNALTESLARQAAVAQGQPATFAGSTAYVLGALRGLGIDTGGVALRDVSGLSRGQQVPARAIADVLNLATTGKLPGLVAPVAALPVAGLTGTLADRFDSGSAERVAGVPRAKTGTLTGSSGLAGTTVDADGRLLTFVILADHVPPTQGTLAARAALDRFVAALTGCGCR